MIVSGATSFVCAEGIRNAAKVVTPESLAATSAKAQSSGTSSFSKSGADGFDGGVNEALTKPNQLHHFASNKSLKYTSQFENITNKYDLALDDVWNKQLMPHQGRHPNAYYDWMLEQMQSLDNIAKGNKKAFLKMFEDVKKTVIDNPDMLRKMFWE